jgi:hypothetical protein
VVKDMSIMPMYHLKKMELYVKGLKSLDLKVAMAAGLLPVIQLDNTDCRDLKLALSHDMDILGAEISPRVVLSEATFYQTSNPDMFILFKSPTHINGMATTLRSGNTVVIIPNLFMTLVVTFFPLFVVFHVLLFALWGWVKIHGGMKIKREESEGDDEESQDANTEEVPEAARKRASPKENGKWGRKKKLAVIVILLFILGGLLYYFAFPRTELSVKTKFNETPSDSATILKRWQYEEGYVHYHGDQMESYNIVISVYFKANGKGYRDTFSHEARDYMRLEFERKVP